MSKTKKIISMLLAVVMVFSMLPASVIAEAANINKTVTGTDVTTAGTITSTAGTGITVDTNGTTEVVRVAAAGSDTVELFRAVDNPDGSGQHAEWSIVPLVTDSGMPAVPSGTFKNVAYAGEELKQTVVKFHIHGAEPDTIVLNSDIGQNLKVQLDTNAGSKDEVNKDYTYVWNITGGQATPGTNINYDITYTIGTKTYHTYAAAHVEYIVRPTGSLVVVYRSNLDGFTRYKTRASGLLTFQSKNMYTYAPLTSSAYDRLYKGWAKDGGSSRGFVNYAAGEAKEEGGNAIKGLGSSGFGSAQDGAYGRSDDIMGTIRRFGNKEKGESAGNYYYGHGYDENRPLAYIFLDAGEGETLRSLNFRMIYQPGDGGAMYYNYLENVGVWRAEDNPGGLTGSASFNFSGADAASNSSGTEIVRIDRTQIGSSHSFQANDVSSGNFKTYSISGSGADTSTYTFGATIVGDQTGSQTTARYVKAHTGLASFKFVRYDTSELRSVIAAVQNGTGVEYNGVTYYNGNNPQSQNFTGGWDNFVAAYKNALGVIAAPDPVNLNSTKPAEITAAVNSLRAAYAGLQGYRASVNYTVNYVIAGTATALISQETGSVDMGATFKTTAPEIKGYTCTNPAAKRTEQIISDRNDVSITYQYTPDTYSLVAITFNDKDDTPSLPVQYGTKLPYTDIMNALGTKAHYTFKGWFYDAAYTRPVSENDTMPVCDSGRMDIFAKWEPTPLNIYLDTQIPGQSVQHLGTVTPKENETVTFAKPANDYVVSGYKFVGYYNDAALTDLTTWPLSFKIGDSDVTLYGRYEDIQGKISFQPNKGTMSTTSISYKPGQPVSQPTPPTRKGYDFAGWYYDEALENPITGWNADGSGTITVNEEVGFIAYAKWDAQTHTINFETGVDYDLEPSKFNTRNEELVSISGKTDSEISEEDKAKVITPSRFEYEFRYWQIKVDGKWIRYDLTTYPAEDITLRAKWDPVDYSAFLDLYAYKMLSGVAVPVYDVEAMKGDIITFRMSSKTNFYTGSSLFIFMYDKDFYEPVYDGKAEFKLNPDNDYVKGLGVLDAEVPTYSAVTDAAALSSRFPEGLDSGKYAAMQLAIDPNIMIDGDGNVKYDQTQPMADESWLVEFKLKVKDDATGSGVVFMDNAWTRNENNPFGTMFYGWTSAQDSVLNTTNNVVTPDLTYASTTVTASEETPVETTVTLDANGGKFADGETTHSYTGRAATEILDFEEAPVLYGYHLDDGERFVDDDGNFWIEGYYPTEDEGNVTYKANWKVNTWTASFYKNKTDETPVKSIQTEFGQPLSSVTKTTQTGYTFNGWKDENGTLIYGLDQDKNLVLVATGFTAPNNDISFYADWTPNKVAYKINFVFNNGTEDVAVGSKSVSAANGAYSGSTIKIVEAVPEVPEENTTYILIKDLSPNKGYGYDAAKNTAENLTATVSGDGKTVITVYCKQVPVDETFNANGGIFKSNGKDTITKSGNIDTSYASNGITEIEIPERTGYTFGGFKYSSTTWSADTVFVGGRTWKAQWTAIDYDVKFSVDGVIDETKTIKVKFDSNITAPAAPTKAGYDFKGWSAVSASDVDGATTSLGKLDTEGKTFYAVFVIKSFNVKYTLDGETYSGFEPTTYNYGTVHNYIAAPAAKTGYEFDGWHFNGSEAKYTSADTYTVPEGDVVISGAFVAKTYNVVFDANKGKYTDGTASQTIPTKYDAAIIKPTVDPGRSGYEFLGWSLSNDNDQTKIVDLSGATLKAEGATYYAVWNATTATYYVDIYKMKVDGSGYDVEEDKTGLTGNVGVECEEYIPARDVEGFTFDEEQSVLKGTVPAPEDGTLRLKVYYTRNQHKVYKSIDGETTEDATYYYGAPVSEPQTPSKTGYEFGGWSWSADHATMPDDDLTATAIFNVNQYPVKFYLTQEAYNAGEDPVSSNDVDYGKVIVPATGTRTGYTFKYWAKVGTTDEVKFTDEGPTVSFGGDTFVGIWEIKTHKLIYKNLTETVREDDVDYGTAKKDLPEAPADPVRTGYKFTGWNYGDFEKMPDSDYTVTAGWTAETYTIKFVDAETDEELFESVTAGYNADISEKIPQENPKKAGYTFVEWSEEIPTVMPDLGETGTVKKIKATFTINQYNVIYIGFDGKTEIGRITGDYGTTVDTTKIPEAPEVEGYSFKEWSAEAPENYPAEDTEIYASYEKETYSLIVDANGGKFADTTEKKTFTKSYGDEIVAPGNPTRTGYTFAGWSEEIPTTMPDLGISGTEKTITAIWEIEKYKIKYVGFEGAELDTLEKEYGATISEEEIPEAPEVEGYKFTGWSEDYTTVGDIGANGAVKTITANYQIQKFTVTFNADGGYFDKDPSKTKIEITGDYGTPVYAPENKPEKEGNTFKDWSKTIPETIPAENVEIKALWTVNDYTITFEANGGKFGEKDSVTETFAFGADTAATKEKLERTGYTFDHWYEEGKAETTEYEFGKMPAKNVTLKASWKINQYTISFDSLGGTDVDSITEDYMTSVADAFELKAPEKTGYTFKYWYKKGDETKTKFTVVTMPAENVELEAFYDVNSYQIIFYDADDNIIEGFDGSYDFGTAVSAIALPADPVKTYYAFGGWTLTKGSEDKFDFTDEEATVGAQKYEFYPIFTKIPVALVAGDESPVKIETKELPAKGIIYGFENALDEKLLESYLAVEGSGEIEVAPSCVGNSFGICGTGTVVNVYDIENGAHKLAATYEIVIFGDLNGDGVANTVDLSIAKRELNSVVKTWSDSTLDEYSEARVRAIDLNKDGVVSKEEVDILTKVVLKALEYDQINGTVAE